MKQEEPTFTFLEFFSGGGMARLGLGKAWHCQFANDCCKKKCASYQANFGTDELVQGYIENVTLNQLGDSAPTLAWGSFPCQDLSLAGNRNGLEGDRSGTFWAFWEHIRSLKAHGCQPLLVVLENVVGAITSRNGDDFRTIVDEIQREGYRVGALVIDAIHFVPQSRPRLFIVAVQNGADVCRAAIGALPNSMWHSAALQGTYGGLPPELQENWIWWDPPAPPKRTKRLLDLIETKPKDVKPHTRKETQRLIDMMTSANQAKLKKAKKSGDREVGTIYRRMRPDGNGGRVQRAELRLDGISGCLRTPSGGSSRQIIMLIKGSSVRSRLLSAKEAARLMGVDDDYGYKLPARYNDAYHLFGDGLAVPVVAWLEQHILRPIAQENERAEKKTACA